MFGKNKSRQLITSFQLEMFHAFGQNCGLSCYLESDSLVIKLIEFFGSEASFTQHCPHAEVQLPFYLGSSRAFFMTSLNHARDREVKWIMRTSNHFACHCKTSLCGPSGNVQNWTLAGEDELIQTEKCSWPPKGQCKKQFPASKVPMGNYGWGTGAHPVGAESWNKCTRWEEDMHVLVNLIFLFLTITSG